MENTSLQKNQRIKYIIVGAIVINALPLLAWLLLSLGIGHLFPRIILAVYSIPAGIVEALFDFTGPPFIWLLWTVPFWTLVIIVVERRVFRWRVRHAKSEAVE